MTFVVGDRVLELSTTTGPGNFTVTGAVSSYQAFSEVATSNGDTFYYAIASGTQWEVGLGTRVSASVFARTTVFDSSNSPAATPVNFLAGTKECWMDLPSAAITLRDGIATVAALQATIIDASLDVITVQGYYAAGDGGGADYVRTSPNPGHSVKVQSLDGAWWVPLPDQSGAISILVVGAIADGDIDDLTVGTDNFQKIQNLIDAHTYYKICTFVSFPPGAFRITSSIQCGYGYTDPTFGAFQTTHVRGGSGGAIDTGDSVLCCDFSDRPGVILQGQRTFSWSGVSLVGKYNDYVDLHQLGLNRLGTPGNGADVDDSDEANWVDSGLAANAHSETAPYAGFASDPFSCDSTPADAYPDLGYASFLEAGNPQYASGYSGDRAFSSKINIADCYIRGFDTCWVSNPAGTAGSDGNGDFIDFRDVRFNKARYGISISHTQCRQVNRTDCDFLQLFTAETTSKHGQQNGRMGGVSINCSFDSVLYIHDFSNDLSVAGPIHYIDAYGENIWRLGYAGNGTAVATSIQYTGCIFSFNSGVPDDDGVWPLRGAPITIFSATAYNQITVIFEGGYMGGYYSVFGMFVGGSGNGDPSGFTRENCLTINGTHFSARGDTSDGIRPTKWERAASSVLGGGLVVMGIPQNSNGMVRLGAAATYNLNTAEGQDLPGILAIGPTCYSKRSRPVCTHAKWAVPVGEDESCQAVLPRLWHPFDKDAQMLGTPSPDVHARLVSRTLTFTMSPQTDYEEIRYGPRKGDVLIDNNTSLVFFVSGRTGDAVTAILQNGFKPGPSPSPSTFVVDDFSATDGYMFCLNARVYTPERYLIGDMVITDNIVSVRRPNGETSPVIDDVLAGDWYLTTQGSFEWPWADDGEVSVVADGLITFTGDARYNEDRHPFLFFIRPSSD